MSMNKMLVIGNVGNDPEMRYTPNGNPVTSFNVATNRRYTTADGEQHEETEWFRVSAWNRLAETCNQYVTKGMKVYVEGRLKSSPWTTQDGELRAGNEISASDVRFLDRPQAAGTAAGTTAGTTAGTEEGGEPASAGDVEDLPW